MIYVFNCCKIEFWEKERLQNMEILRQIEVVDRVIFFIEKNFCTESCLQDLHDFISVQCSIYEETFHEQVGLTIHEYISSIRTEKAIELLKRSPLDVKDVSNAVGINSYYEFAHVFEELIGMSPGNYREQIFNGEVS